MNLCCKALTSFIILCFLYTFAIARPHVRTKTNYYNIEGVTSLQLIKQMHKKGPYGRWAYTTWDVRWTSSCKLYVTITHTYPRWRNIYQADRNLQSRWNIMMMNLRIHEKGHASHGINAAKEIEYTKCKKHPLAILQKWAIEDRRYDQRTRGGFTQGVKFP